MIGPAEIEDILLDLADAERASLSDEVEPAVTRRWGIVTPPSWTDADRSPASVDGQATVPQS